MIVENQQKEKKTSSTLLEIFVYVEIIMLTKQQNPSFKENKL
jgi:hypothetical protein